MKTVICGAALPEARIVVVRRDLVEAELLVVVGADPLGGVDRAALQRRIDVAARDLLRHEAELLQHLAGKAADAHLQALQVGDGLDLLAEPAAHLRAGVAGRHAVQLCLAKNSFIRSMPPPWYIQAFFWRGFSPHGIAVGEGEGRVLADVVVGRGLAHLDGAVRDRIGEPGTCRRSRPPRRAGSGTCRR